jgi:hypothetical protein
LTLRLITAIACRFARRERAFSQSLSDQIAAPELLLRRRNNPRLVHLTPAAFDHLQKSFNLPVLSQA